MNRLQEKLGVLEHGETYEDGYKVGFREEKNISTKALAAWQGRFPACVALEGKQKSRFLIQKAAF